MKSPSSWTAAGPVPRADVACLGYNADHDACRRTGHKHDRLHIATGSDFSVLDDDLTLQRTIWSPDKASYIALAEALREPSDLRSYYDALDPRLSAYLREAMLAYADVRMQ